MAVVLTTMFLIQSLHGQDAWASEGEPPSIDIGANLHSWLWTNLESVVRILSEADENVPDDHLMMAESLLAGSNQLPRARQRWLQILLDLVPKISSRRRTLANHRANVIGFYSELDEVATEMTRFVEEKVQFYDRLSLRMRLLFAGVSSSVEGTSPTHELYGFLESFHSELQAITNPQAGILPRLERHYTLLGNDVQEVIAAMRHGTRVTDRVSAKGLVQVRLIRALHQRRVAEPFINLLQQLEKMPETCRTLLLDEEPRRIIFWDTRSNITLSIHVPVKPGLRKESLKIQLNQPSRNLQTEMQVENLSITSLMNVYLEGVQTPGSPGQLIMKGEGIDLERWPSLRVFKLEITYSAPDGTLLKDPLVKLQMD